MTGDISRRRFLRISAAAGGGLMVGVSLGFRRPGTGEGPLSAEYAPGWFEANAFVEISTDGGIRIGAPVPEVGQGVSTALPLLVAHELRVPLDAVTVWRPPADGKYGGMTASGSDSVVDYWEPLRNAGAAARSALQAAAAARWQVDVNSCEVRGGSVVHDASGRTLGYGALAAEAAALAAVEASPLPWPAKGITESAVDPEMEGIVTGATRFGLDVRPEGMLFAVVARPPAQNQRVVRFDADAAMAVPGVVHVAKIEPLIIQGLRYGAVRGGVAVVGTSTWAAMEGRRRLGVEWGGDVMEPASDIALFEHMRAAALDDPERMVRTVGRDLPTVDHWVERLYELPLVAHGCMEPVNFTARVGQGRCDAMGPSQNPRFLRALVGAALGLKPEAVAVHPTRIGGGFGRRLAVDYGVEAALVARTVPDRYVQVVWSREDDLGQDYYRPPSVHRMRAGIDADGSLVAWEHHLVTSSLARQTFGPDAADPAVYDVQGADYVPPELPWIRLGHTSVDVPLQLGSLRSVAHSFNTFAVNSFIDELAGELGVDPLPVHRSVIGVPRQLSISLALQGRRGMVHVDTGRLLAVLDAATARAGWGAPAGSGQGMGLAWSVFKGTYVAHVATVVTDTSGRPRVSKVVAAVDCGTVVDPNGVRAQCEGAVMDGLATVLHWGVRYRNGRVLASNFDGFPLLRMVDAPRVEVILMPDGSPPTGMGEPPYPSVAPAVTAAVFAATGRRHRRLPVDAL